MQGRGGGWQLHCPGRWLWGDAPGPVLMAALVPAVGRLHAAGAAQFPAHPAAGGGGACAPAAAPLRPLPPEDAGGAGHAHARVTTTLAHEASQCTRTLARRRVGAPGRGVERGTVDPPGCHSPHGAGPESESQSGSESGCPQGACVLGGTSVTWGIGCPQRSGCPQGSVCPGESECHLGDWVSPGEWVSPRERVS